MDRLWCGAGRSRDKHDSVAVDDRQTANGAADSHPGTCTSPVVCLTYLFHVRRVRLNSSLTL